MSFTPEEEAELRILLGITNKTVSDLELAPTLAGDMLMEVESGSGTFSSSINNIKSRNIYRTKANNPNLFYLLAIINDNTTKGYFDNINDQELNIL